MSFGGTVGAPIDAWSYRPERHIATGTVTFTFNRIAGTNYGFLNGKPATATLLDVLGPWPVTS